MLAECGNDIDAAIRRLNQLRLGSAEAQAAAAAQQQQQQAAGAQQRQAEGAATPPPQEQAPGTQEQQQQQQQQQAAAAAHGGEQQQAAAGAPGPQTAEQWVDALVGEMAAAASIPDARGRAGKVLHSFEQFVLSRGGGKALEQAQRENAILKRAVQIQNARMQEGAGREAEVAGLKAAVAQYQERLRHLEMSNYSLALHLQKAAGGAQGHVATGHRPPDVY